jgi:hypothetical protein
MKVLRALVVAGLATGTALLPLGGAVANRGNDAETIRLLDDCDPASFNAALGPGACVGDGDVTFARFLDKLADGGHNHWSNNPEETHVEAGEGLRLVNRGGEFHTFTKVRSFARGGCVPELNEPLGLETRSAAFCAAAFSDRVTTLLPGAESNVPARRLTHRHNHFQCMIHPWMTTTVDVRR